jgi:hypothetical protein
VKEDGAEYMDSVPEFVVPFIANTTVNQHDTAVFHCKIRSAEDLYVQVSGNNLHAFHAEICGTILVSVNRYIDIPHLQRSRPGVLIGRCELTLVDPQ